MTDDELEKHYRGWSNEALHSWRIDIVRFGLSNLELGWVEREIERRKEAEEVA